MIGHLGERVSALLDGQLSPAEAEKAWAHVHACHFCRDLVEREGWIKTRLAGLSAAPDTHARLAEGRRWRTARSYGAPSAPPVHGRSRSNVALLGGTALGAAVAGCSRSGSRRAAPRSNDGRRSPA